MNIARSNDAMRYERSARTSLQWWMLLLVGTVFVWAGSTIDPQSNCSSDGECAPWLVPIAKWMGILFATAAAGYLIINPTRGSFIDASGTLIWWKNRTSRSVGDQGKIHPSQIARIKIVRESDGDDGVHLYDMAGERQAYFDHEVIPWPYDRWAKRLVERWPHIELEIIDG